VNTYRAQINIQEIRDDIWDKAEALKDKIEKRRMQQRKIANEKEEAYLREQQRKAEQRQQRIGQVESKREEMKKRNELKKKVDVRLKDTD
jgi:spore cortex formation protein SpoVR/YcgB (stage V sporulation)